MKFGIGIDSPIEVITFGIFMLAYKYSTAEALMLLATDIIALGITGRFKIDKLFTTIALLVIALCVPFINNLPLTILAICVLLFRYVVDFIGNLFILRNDDFITKLPQKIINAFFWVLFYLRFGEAFANLMA
jgi:hypothetical protein